MAIANNPPRSTACSILAITFRWSADQGRWNVNGKYDSQKNRKSPPARAFRSGLTTAGSSLCGVYPQKYRRGSSRRLQLDRLTRSFADQAKRLARFRRRGVAFLTVSPVAFYVLGKKMVAAPQFPGGK
jgi:hypothetical protein